MSDKRYLGNIITPTPTAPAGPFENDAAPGVWSLQEAYTYIKAGTWPTAGNTPTIALFGGGTTGSVTNVIDTVIIETTGNATDFGDLSVARQALAAASSTTRGVFAGGLDAGNPGAGLPQEYVNTIDYVTIASAGNATDFGDLPQTRILVSGSGNQTRGLFNGGNVIPVNTITYITIATAGNATDFGDMSSARYGTGSCSSSTRSVFGGGSESSNVIDYVTIASAGNATDFGDLTTGRETLGACSSSTRGLFGGGNLSSNTIDYVTIATAGNATDFGDLTENQNSNGATSSKIRGIFAGGASYKNVISYVTIATTGNASDFGDLSVARQEIGACSSAHGGL